MTQRSILWTGALPSPRTHILAALRNCANPTPSVGESGSHQPRGHGAPTLSSLAASIRKYSGYESAHNNPKLRFESAPICTDAPLRAHESARVQTRARLTFVSRVSVSSLSLSPMKWWRDGRSGGDKLTKCVDPHNIVQRRAGGSRGNPGNGTSHSVYR